MSPDFSGLSDLAKKSPEKIARGWQPPTLADFGTGRVLAFDQSLTATGWVEVRYLGRGQIEVLASGRIAAGGQDQPSGVERDLHRSTAIYLGARSLIGATRGRETALVHESPPHAGNVKGGGTSSLMAATAVRCAAAYHDLDIEMLGAQPAKKLVCGNAVAPKPLAHQGLTEHCFPLIQGTYQITNEATRDALLIALLWLSRRPK